MEKKGQGLKFSFNSPAVLVFTLLCFAVMLLGKFTGHGSTRLFFSVYRSSLLDPLTYVRMVGHVLGHGDWDHLIGNVMYILILGPMLEEKYGTKNLCFVMLVTALVVGLASFIFFPATALLGASGIVFPDPAVLRHELRDQHPHLRPGGGHLHGEILSAVTLQNSISYFAHILGAVGTALGFLMNKKRPKTGILTGTRGLTICRSAAPPI